VVNARVFEIRPGHSFSGGHTASAALKDCFPDIPALPETLLLMELRSHEISVDLREMSRVVLDDFGATLQILRLAAREYPENENRPVRIEDCISDLGLDACLKAAARQAVTHHARHRTVLETWAHSREIAHYSRLVAGEMGGGAHPDEAYLTGLFHTLGEVSSLLGWETQRNSTHWASTGLRLAEHFCLPLCVQEFFREVLHPETGAGWVEIVQMAHELARRSPIDCPLYADLDADLGLQEHKRA
jgi:hypothetical protein